MHASTENPKSLNDKERDWAKKHNEIVFASTGFGMGINGLIV
jgi:hypothetical protein